MKYLRKAWVLLGCILIMCLFAGTDVHAEDLHVFDDSEAKELKAGLGYEITNELSYGETERYVLHADCNGNLNLTFSHEGEESDDGWFWNIFKLEDGTYKEISRNKVYVEKGLKEYVVDIPCVKGDVFGILIKPFQNSCPGFEYTLGADIVEKNHDYRELTAVPIDGGNTNIIDGLSDADDVKAYVYEPRVSGTLNLTFETYESITATDNGWVVELSDDEGGYLGVFNIAPHKTVSLPTIYCSQISKIRVVVRSGNLGYNPDTFYIGFKFEEIYTSTVEYSNNTFGRALSISDGYSYGTLTDTYEKNYYKYAATQDGAFYLKIENTDFNINDFSGCYVGIYRYDADNYSLQEIGFRNLKQSQEDYITPKVGCNKGDIFYILLSGSKGSMQKINLVCEECDYESEKNDSFETATEIKFSHNDTYNFYFSNTVRANTFSGEDEDYFVFTMPEDGGISFMLGRDEIEEEYDDLCLYVYKESVPGRRDLIYYETPEDYLNTGYFGGKKGDRFYVKISEDYEIAFDIGYYLDVSVDPQPIYEIEVNDTFENAMPIESNSTMTGMVGSITSLDKVDYYALQILPGEEVYFRIRDYVGNGGDPNRLKVSILTGSTDDNTVLLSGFYQNDGILFGDEPLKSETAQTYYVEIKYEDSGRKEYFLDLISNNTAPEITTQPKTANVKTGKAAIFSVKAEGNNLTYQWQYRLAGTTAWKDWAGKTTATITVPYDAKKDGMGLRCKITSGGKYVVSSGVKLNYKSGPSITRQPVDVSVDTGHAAVFSVAASGETVKYQWQYKLAGATSFKEWAGKTSATITVPYDAKKNGMTLQCKVTDKYGIEVISTEAKLSYITGPAITRQPADVCVATGHAAPFSVKADGTGLKYQWQYKLSNGTTFKDWAGKTTASITVPYDAKKNGMQLQCVITDANGGKTVSSIAKLSYSDSPVVMVQPVDVTVESGHAAPFQVKVSGDGTLTYQWQYKLANGTTFKDWAGKTTGLIKVPYDAKKDGMQLQCVVTDGNGKKVTSGIAVLRYTK